MNQDHTDQTLEALFAEAREAGPEPLPASLHARLMDGAEAAMPRRSGGGWLRRLRTALAEIGGAPGLAGVGVAGLAGVWIGFTGPGMAGDLVGQFWQGAASVSPTVSGLVDNNPIGGSGDDLLSLMTGTME